MIQELLGGGSAPTGFIGDRKIISVPFPPSSTSPSPTCPSTTTTTPLLAVQSTTTTTTTASTTTVLNPSNSSSGNNNNSSEQPTQNLRCPRCDSTNTKFCYYNNYNLTQPRHFCKTCRRYWTKGGTLRNVPIGGGCRKNRTTSTSSGSSPASGLSKSSNAMAKAKASFSTEMLVNGSPGFLGNGFMDHLHHHHAELSPSSSPAFWPSLPQGHSSHILASLRGTATQFQNPNPSPNLTPITSGFTSLKSEGTPTLGLDPYGNGAPSPFGSFSRSNHHQLNGFGLGGSETIPNGGNGGSNILELYQRLKSSSGYNENPGPVILGNGLGSSSSALNSTVLETAPSVAGGVDNLGGYGMSSGFSCWSEFPTVPINGAFP